MNKKLGYIFVILVAGLFLVSACENAVGRKVVNRNNVGNVDKITGVSSVVVDCGTCTKGNDEIENCVASASTGGNGFTATIKCDAAVGCISGCEGSATIK